ncbi:unnamed protein product [Phytophthora fragariaefolia]|uniref:Unnamed protein product n=1 Tax=Phytophthora fragariaefolia TaxID=1490495 RepID=A0A9W6YMF3_9STRA|nr:unnamed protein product [Phytophthora fragariaefolia]
MHNTEILQAAQEADRDGTRTIAVVTKVDLVDAGAELAVHELLLNKKKRMHLGYHAVKCRSQFELNVGTSIETGVANEMAFFGRHEYWRRLPVHLWGVPKLSERLVSILQDTIRRSLPKVFAEISTRMADTQRELARLGTQLDSPGAQRQQFGKWANQYLRLMEAAINGQYELFHRVLGRSSSDNISLSEAHLRAVLRQKDLIFRSEIEASGAIDFLESYSYSAKSEQDNRIDSQADVKVGNSVTVKLEGQDAMVCKVIQTRGTDVFCDEFPRDWLGASNWSFASNKPTTLKEFILANRGDELTIFPSYRVFCSCVQRSVREWELPAAKLLEHYYSDTKAASSYLISILFAGCGNERVERFFKKATDRVLAVLKKSAQRELELLLQHEARPYTQDRRLYDELDRLRQQELHSRLEAALPAGDRHGMVSIADVTRALGEISMGPFGTSSSERETLEMEVALRAYVEVASHRFVDVVPMKLNGLLLESFLREMESELLGAATDAKIAELLQEIDEKAMLRHQLLDALNILETGMQLIENTSSGY